MATLGSLGRKPVDIINKKMNQPPQGAAQEKAFVLYRHTAGAEIIYETSFHGLRPRLPSVAILRRLLKKKE